MISCGRKRLGRACGPATAQHSGGIPRGIFGLPSLQSCYYWSSQHREAIDTTAPDAPADREQAGVPVRRCVDQTKTRDSGRKLDDAARRQWTACRWHTCGPRGGARGFLSIYLSIESIRPKSQEQRAQRESPGRWALTTSHFVDRLATTARPCRANIGGSQVFLLAVHFGVYLHWVLLV